MTFGKGIKREIHERSGFYCQVCGQWRPPHKHDAAPNLEAHSTDRTHLDWGTSTCSRNLSPCHTLLHQVTNDPDELKKITETAAQLTGLSVAMQMAEAGVDEKRIRRVVERICSTDEPTPKQLRRDLPDIFYFKF